MTYLFSYFAGKNGGIFLAFLVYNLLTIAALWFFTDWDLSGAGAAWGITIFSFVCAALDAIISIRHGRKTGRFI